MGVPNGMAVAVGRVSSDTRRGRSCGGSKVKEKRVRASRGSGEGGRGRSGEIPQVSSRGLSREMDLVDS